MTDDRCHCCGQVLPGQGSGDADALYWLLVTGQPHREVYRAHRGGWYVTYGGGQWSPDAVDALVRRRTIVSVYDNAPHEAYHIGRTIAFEATMAARRAQGRKAAAIDIFADETAA